MTNINDCDRFIIDKAYLKNHKDFVEIDNTYYGGDQAWLFNEGYISKFQANRSCGVVAASNVFHYMSKYNSKIKLNQDYGNISKESFLENTMLIYKFIRPRLYGIPTVGVMKRGLKKFGKSINGEIKTYELINPSNTIETINFISKGIANNNPIMMITWNTKIKNLNNHWVTITGYYKTISGEHFVVTSNWGRKESFSIDKWLEHKSFYKGLFYINLSHEN